MHFHFHTSPSNIKYIENGAKIFNNIEKAVEK